MKITGRALRQAILQTKRIYAYVPGLTWIEVNKRDLYRMLDQADDVEIPGFIALDSSEIWLGKDM